MRKYLILILSLMLATSLCACGSKDDSNVSNEGNSITEEQGKGESEKDEVIKNDSKVELMFTFKDPSKPVVFDYPNLKCIEEGTSRVFKNSKYVIVYCRENGNCDMKEIPDALSEKFYNSTDIHLTAPFDSFLIEKTDVLDISGQEVLQLNGDVIVKRGDGTLVNLPMQGYSFVKDDTIYELIAVLREETNDANQAEMEATVEAMIKTLRDER